MPLSNDEQRQLDDIEWRLYTEDRSFALLMEGVAIRLRLRLWAICVTSVAAGTLLGISVAMRLWWLGTPGLVLLSLLVLQAWLTAKALRSRRCPGRTRTRLDGSRLRVRRAGHGVVRRLGHVVPRRPGRRHSSGT